MTSVDRELPANTQIQAARQLWFGTYHGMLSTHSTALPGYPFGSLAPICRDFQGRPLLLLSHLAQHTQNLLSNPCCSLMLQQQGNGDIQQLGRLTCLAKVEKVKHDADNLSQRYFRYFPETQEYYEKLNFHFYRLAPERCYFIGGFGSARWIDPSRLLPEFTFTARDEAEILAQTTSHSLLMESKAGNISPIGIDCLGLDLTSNNQLSRIMFTEPATTQAHFLEQLRTAHLTLP